ncbi:MAG: cytochrome c biogenesis protein CcsA [Bdellovibrionaceae bacterium]|nr:cytochrome c biogenesis protein CcsA [Pseudobdellovibrionaceae bacterium]MBX3033490.1 cytochrome c biogenesis protein CcsA [Pseudobdellovibrionaceae bacterium]
MKMKRWVLVAMMAVGAVFRAEAGVKTGEALRALPVQDGGRVKPYDTFAQETLNGIYGKKTYEGRDAWEIVLTWMLAPTVWADKEIFELRNKDLLSALGLDSSRRWFKGDEIFGKERFPELMQDLRARRESKEKLSPYFQDLQRLENQWFLFREMATGRLLRVLPPADGDTWIPVADLPAEAQPRFLEITQEFIARLSGVEGSPERLDRAVVAFEDFARARNPQLVPSKLHIATEIFYSDFHPFRWAYVAYLLGAVALLLFWSFNKNYFVTAAWVFILAGFLLNTVGFGLRVYLAGRPPVSNMYETVVWVAWGAVLFAMILEALYKTRLILLAGAITGWLALVVADSAPVVLDPSLQPLEAVLRSNYWLIIHVMTITISYAAFFLAFILGDVGLIYHLKNPRQHADKIRGVVNAIYRCMQIGVAFLAPGIILGGVWADYSWGRFWGWDPKETWALIVLLGYLAVLHGRLSGWIKDFGLLITAVVTFSLVIMAWYGVNFVLGAGLHSYGFGAGGVEYVGGFLFLHFLFVVYVWILHRSRAPSAR